MMEYTSMKHIVSGGIVEGMQTAAKNPTETNMNYAGSHWIKMASTGAEKADIVHKLCHVGLARLQTLGLDNRTNR
eukprot:10392540-Heterocapsa_arctica.AAC.1